MNAILFAVLFAAGCTSTHVREPLPAGWAADDSHARTEFWYSLTSRPVAANDEVFHGLLLYLDGSDKCVDYAARVKEMQSRKMLPADFRGAADEAADRGTLAYALVRVLKIDGGLTMHLFGDSPRYALRALEYRGIYPTCSANQGISGAQFVGIMQKAEEYERGNPADAPAVKLPDEIRHEGGALAALDKKAGPPNDRVRFHDGEFAGSAPRTVMWGERESVRDADPTRIASATNDLLSAVRGGEGSGGGPFREFAQSADLDGRPVAALAPFTLLDARPLTPALSPEYDSTALAAGRGEGADAGHVAIYLNDISAEDARALFLADAEPAVAPAEAPASKAPKKLNVIITGVQGDSVEARKTEKDPWTKARVGLVLHEAAEFRTGPKSAVRFIIPPDQTFCLDSQGTTKVLDAVANGNKVKTDIGLSRGRMRYDV
ncbi:MAG TPA: hypothetical protein VG274_00695, partial [Rhizomicrobium sp.]|nr:hypothetical protein [Rhizomicrobium sp.]